MVPTSDLRFMVLGNSQRLILTGVGVGIVIGLVVGGIGAYLGLSAGVRGGLTGALTVITLAYLNRRMRLSSKADAGDEV